MNVGTHQPPHPSEQACTVCHPSLTTYHCHCAAHSDNESSGRGLQEDTTNKSLSKLHHHLASKEKQDFFRELQNLTLPRPAMTQVPRNKTTWLHAPNFDGRCRKLHQPQIRQVANTELHHVYFFSFLIFAFALRVACSAKPLLCESSAVFVLWNFDTMLLCQPSCNLRCPHLHRRAIVLETS